MKKNLQLAKKWITEESKQEQFAKEKTEKDIYDAMQSLEYEINTLYSSQGHFYSFKKCRRMQKKVVDK